MTGLFKLKGYKMFKIGGLLLSLMFVGCVHTSEKPKEVVSSDPMLEKEFKKNFMEGCASESGQTEFCQCCVDALLSKYSAGELILHATKDPEEAERRLIVVAQEKQCFSLFMRQKVTGI